MINVNGMTLAEWLEVCKYPVREEYVVWLEDAITGEVTAARSCEHSASYAYCVGELAAQAAWLEAADTHYDTANVFMDEIRRLNKSVA